MVWYGMVWYGRRVNVWFFAFVFDSVYVFVICRCHYCQLLNVLHGVIHLKLIAVDNVSIALQINYYYGPFRKVIPLVPKNV